MLTSRQKELVDYIASETKRRGGVCPTYREIGDALGVSKVAAFMRAKRAAEKGALKKLPGRSRAIEVVGQRWAAFKFDDDTKDLRPLNGGAHV